MPVHVDHPRRRRVSPWMDVTLVLTHRCNLDCGYCYAGQHHKTDMDTVMLDAGVELLFADDAREVQLGFFGGEPLIAFDSLRYAVLRAETRAAQERRELLIQVTTNGAAMKDEHAQFFAAHRIKVTVSIDGVAEAHDLNRPSAGGGSSFARVVGGMRCLLAAGVRPDAMMVITPETTPYVYRSVSWLWTEGIGTVRANLLLSAKWGQQERDELREQLTCVGVELAGRQLRGEHVRFQPFERGMGRAAPARAPARKREQVVVGTSGNLYPCAPMVGEDRDSGREATMRMGHISAGAAALAAAIKSRGAGCSDGGKCACAAYLETGDRDKAGPVGLWFAALCREIGAGCAEAMARGAAVRGESSMRRRPFLIGVAAAAAGLSVGVPLMIRAGLFGKGDSAPPLGGLRAGEDVRTSGALAIPEPELQPLGELQPPGGISIPIDHPPPHAKPPHAKPPHAKPPHARPPKPHAVEPMIRGNIGAPETQIDGDVGEP